MDYRLEVTGIPVSDVDASKTFYSDVVGFAVDHDISPGPGMRVVQLTPPGSPCSIVIGEGMPLGEPGTTRALSWWSTTSTPLVRNSSAVGCTSLKYSSSALKVPRARGSHSSQILMAMAGPSRNSNADPMNRVELPASDIQERGRDCYQRRRWVDAFAALSQADQIEPLAAADLWLLAWSAHLSGRDEEFARAMSRAYRAYLDAGEPLAAARCAGWLGTILDLCGQAGPGAGWLSRAQRLVEREGV